VNRNATLGLGALLGAAAALVWDRRARRRPAVGPSPDARTSELRQKLAEAQRADVDETDFGAAGMGAETLVEEPPPSTAAPPPAPRPKARPAAPPRPPAPPPEPPPGDEFEAMRRRIHEEGKAAAEEMRSAPDETS
jgi:hypothetical protein